MKDLLAPETNGVSVLLCNFFNAEEFPQVTLSAGRVRYVLHSLTISDLQEKTANKN